MLKSKSVKALGLVDRHSVRTLVVFLFFFYLTYANTIIILIGQKYSRRLAYLCRRQYWSRTMFNIVYVVYHVNTASNS